MNLTEEEVCHLYTLEKMSIRPISLIAKCRCSTISKILKSKNIKLRTRRCVDYINYTLDHNYFNKINTKEKAYLLGLMFADGGVSSTSNTISLTSNDLELINFFKTQIRCSKEIYKNPSHKNAYTYYFCSPKMKSDLINLGCVPKKSLVLKFPNKIPKNLLRDFLRGNFDGDGSIHKSKNKNSQTQVYFLGTKNFVTNIKKILNKKNIVCNKVKKEVNIFRLVITGKKNILNLKKFMYYKNCFSLIRKKNKFNFL